MNFEQLNLHPNILKAVKKNGFTEPTPIQEKCIPEIRAGKDVVGQSLTGSGKTAAYVLPLLEKIEPGQGIQVVILTPTRELTTQVRDTILNFSSFMRINVAAVYGGVAISPQIDSLRKAEIVVATPGRMLDHMERRTIRLSNVSLLILDEADKMFEMGFVEDVEKIIHELPPERQTLLFSATISSEISHLIKKHLKNPVMIKEQLHVDKTLLKQIYYDIKQQEKFSLLMHLLKTKTSGLSIIFCSTRREVDAITTNLKMNGIHAMAVHGGLTQSRRSHAVDSLKSQNIRVLVATDVAARGLDIKDVTNVYNYDSPKNSSEYTHRIGRTARAGKQGEAVILLTERDYENFREVTRDKNIQIERGELPHFERIEFVRSPQRERGHFGGREDRGRSGGFRSGGERSGGFRSGGFRSRDHGSSHSEGGFRSGGSSGGFRSGGFRSRSHDSGDHESSHSESGFRSHDGPRRSGGFKAGRSSRPRRSPFG
ncbi:putative ATP-dependent RNA helicase [uncultured archaeon]|nr:putative ATP-dependent RNA helicase [uncultured archaeon]